MMELSEVLSFYSILMCALGTFVGIVIGALPGLTPTMGVALFLPFTFTMDTVPAFALLLGIYIGGTYGGSISAILIRTPGTPSSAATLLDGYPLARQGKASEALSASVITSTIGGLISCVILFLLAERIARAALAFGPAEYFSVGLFGLSVVASFVSKDLFKGLFSVFFGLFLSCIGMDNLTGFDRFSYGNVEAMGGIQTVSALIGLFAFVEVFSKAETIMRDKHNNAMKVSNKFISVKELSANWFNILRSTIIGTFIGIVPATGGGTASWIAYNEARRASKNPDLFGNGSMEALIAAETSKNAVPGGAMIPLLTLGIPGDTITAVLLGALMVQGLAPGPLLFTEHSEIVVGIYVMMFISNIFMLAMGLAGTRLFAQIIKVPNNILMPTVMMLCFVGTYAIGGKVFDVKTALYLGLIGYVFSVFKIATPPALLGLILGQTVESNMRRALMLSSGDWSVFVSKPISAVFIALSVFSVAFTLIRDARANKSSKKDAEEQLNEAIAESEKKLSEQED